MGVHLDLEKWKWGCLGQMGTLALEEEEPQIEALSLPLVLDVSPSLRWESGTGGKSAGSERKSWKLM